MNDENAKAATADALRAQIYEMEASGGLTPLGAADMRHRYGLTQPWETDAGFDDSQRVVVHPNGRLSVTLWEERNWPDNGLAEWPSLLNDSYFDAVVDVGGHRFVVSRHVAEELARLRVSAGSLLEEEPPE